jgi:hypothetical protein
MSSKTESGVQKPPGGLPAPLRPCRKKPDNFGEHYRQVHTGRILAGHIHKRPLTG